MSPPGAMLGRHDELAILHATVAAARNGHGGALVVVGDPGIGKTTLLDAVTTADATVRCVAVPGFAIEAELAYSGLQRLVQALDTSLDALPQPQREAVEVAVGRAVGDPPERALVGLGTLSLLAAAGDRAPTVCVVDDAHHLDRETLESLGFVARRLSAESIGLVFATRHEDATARALAGVPELRLRGLARDDAAALLRRSVRGALDPDVVAEIIDGTGGNPLALSDLGERWSAGELTSATRGQEPVRLAPQLEAHYSTLVSGLPEATRRWLVVAAAESTGDAALIGSAAAALGIPDSASASAEIARLVEVRAVVRFRHPLVRSAVYGAAADRDRRAAHTALRDAAGAGGLVEVAAWHDSAACVGPDGEVAARLEAVADATGARGGIASRAHLLARAADLSPDPAARARRLVNAAEAAIGAGSGALSRSLLDRIDVAALGTVDRGTMRTVDALCSVYLSDPNRLPSVVGTLVRAADDFHGIAPAREQRALLLALNFALSTEDRAEGWPIARLSERMRAAADAAPGRRSLALRAAAAFALDDYEAAVPALREARAIFDDEPDAELVDLATFVAVVTVGLCDFEDASRVLIRLADAARDRGALRALDTILWVLSSLEVGRVNPRAARLHLERCTELRRAVGHEEEQAVNAALLIWQGLPPGAGDQMAAAMSAAGYGGVARMALGTQAIVENASGEYATARERLASLVARPYLQASLHHLPELVEAAVRSGSLELARDAAARVDTLARATGSRWARGMARRAAALLADDRSAEDHHRASIDLLDMPGHAGDAARGRLLYGEWLRRVRRRADARVQLRHAADVLIDLEARPFADRALRELVAAGGSGEDRAGTRATGPDLSPQEAQVAQMASRGATNAEIGAALFISPNTVDYHLRKVFRKLGVTSRRQLADRLPGA